MKLKRHVDFINESLGKQDKMISLRTDLSRIVDIKEYKSLSEDSITLKHSGEKKEQEIIKAIEKYFELVDFDVFNTNDEYLGRVWVYDFFIKEKNENVLFDSIKARLENVLPNIEVVDKDERNPTSEYTLMSDGQRVASWRYMGPEDLNTDGDIEGNENVSEGEYLLCGTIVVENEFRRKGIYSAIIYAGYDYAKSMGLEGIASLQFDIDSGEFERTPEATAVWEKLLKTDNKVAKIMVEEEWSEEPESNYFMN